MTAIAHTYAYAFPSQVSDWGLRLATSGGEERHPHFFEGRVEVPREFSDTMLCLSAVVRSRFYAPLTAKEIALRDPVVTSTEEMLRFEGFSSCCGVYARADLSADSFEATYAGRGTTNVDFNNRMCGALASLRTRDDVRLAVGADEVRLTQGDTDVVEKKVKLPVRWIKGFSEVQAYQPALEPRLEASGAEARRFLRNLPSGRGALDTSWIVPVGRGWRLTKQRSETGVAVRGTERLRLVEPLVHDAKSVRLWAHDDSGVHAWEILLETGRFWLLVSPELSRGFSGEGQMLATLAGDGDDAALAKVRGALAWQTMLDPAELASRLALPEDDVRGALARLGGRGLVGFDPARGAYYHRELPFDLDKVEMLQPRLRGARDLLDDGGVRAGDGVFWVRGTNTEHRVTLGDDGDRCTCRWFAKHQGQRGPCKHILAARMHDDAGRA